MPRESKHSDFGLLFWLHLAIILLFYSSPFWLAWYLILAVILVFYLQLLCLGGCILTKAEFGESEHNSFYWYYLTKMGFKFSQKGISFFVTYFIPAVVLMTALFLQVS